LAKKEVYTKHSTEMMSFTTSSCRKIIVFQSSVHVEFE